MQAMTNVSQSPEPTKHAIQPPSYLANGSQAYWGQDALLMTSLEDLPKLPANVHFFKKFACGGLFLSDFFLFSSFGHLS